ncbi:hypothetical protein D3C72_2042160 [compost metagenome]
MRPCRLRNGSVLCWDRNIYSAYERLVRLEGVGGADSFGFADCRKRILRNGKEPTESDSDLAGLRSRHRVGFCDLERAYLHRRIACDGGRRQATWGLYD